MRTIVAHPLLFSHSATCAAELTTPNITRNLSGHALTGPVVVGVNETISIWCMLGLGLRLQVAKCRN